MIPSRLIVIALSLMMAGAALPQASLAQDTLSPVPHRDYAPVASGSLMQDKDFYLFTLLKGLPKIRAVLAADSALAEETSHRRAVLATARSSCNGDGACLTKALLWPDDEIGSTGDLLVARLDQAGLLHELAEAHMRRSGFFARYQMLDDKTMVGQAWGAAAKAINHILHVYGLGEPPLYPQIDSISYAPGDPMWKDAIDDMVDVALEEPHKGELFFNLSLSSALDVLTMNDRDEPTRFEPLDRGENAAAIAYAKTVVWEKYRYPAILIPGRSPVLKDNPLSPEAKMKMRLAARRFRDGLAPLIIVSGGFCNPSQTRFNEAEEMKRELMRSYHIPEKAILIDPFARHTTTNLRNCERLSFQIAAPLDRTILVTTTAYQSRYMEGQVFHDRCQRELGYLCFRDFRRLSLFDAEMKLPLVSLHRDANDPLDP